MRQLNEKKALIASKGLYPLEKKGKWGYADSEGKFLIRPVFTEVLQMGPMNVGFVSYQNEAGAKVWTLLDYRGVYLTELEFDSIVADFDDRGLAVVMKDGKYGMITNAGQMFVDCIFETYLERGPVRLLRTCPSSDWAAVVNDRSDAGVTVYSFGAKEPVIVRAEDGYGIISPRNQSVVADFIYDSVHELVPGSVYCLKKGPYKYLYADDKLSAQYEEVIPAADKAYFVVKQDGIYGIVNQAAASVVDCKYTTYLNYGVVELLHSPTLSECEVVVKDSSADGYTVHRFGVKENIIVKAETGYGIIDPRNQSVLADFIYDSVQEYVHGSVYCLHKGSDSYLYAGNKLSERYEDVIPGPSNAYFIVKQNGLYGVVNRAGDSVVECMHTIRQNHGAVLLLRSEAEDNWVAVAKDFSTVGYTVYTFKDNEPIIVRAENGFGIISPRNQSVVADFVYDSVQEYVSGSVYCLQKGAYKYLYADDKLSQQNEEVIPDSDIAYFIVKQGGLYGVMDLAGNVVVECMYTTCLNHGPVLLLQSESLDECKVIVKDSSPVGYSVQSLPADGYVIVKTEGGYGVVSPRTQSIVADFKYESVAASANGYFIVKQGGLYGVVNNDAEVLVECKYDTYLERGRALLLTDSASSGWDVLIKGKSGYGVHSFAADETIIVMSESGYGIISKRDLSIVADFVYDSVQELVPGTIYCLQRGASKYLCIDEVMSSEYEDVIPSADNEYFVVRQNGLYGVLTPKNEVLLACSQTEVPVLKKDEYTRFYVGDVPVYVKVDKLISAAEYDAYLYEKYMDSPADYLLDGTLTFDLKKYVNESIQKTYGTSDFDRIIGIPQAAEYAATRKFILLSSDQQNAKYLDLETGDLRDAGEVVFHAFPSNEGYPMYASARREGKFGIIDIRNHSTVIPFEYDQIVPVGNGYVLMYAGSQVYFYNVTNAEYVSVNPYESASMEYLSNGYVSLRQDSKEKIYDINANSWLLPEDHNVEHIVHISHNHSSALFAKNGDKGALFSLATGERLTDYLFDEVERELVQGRYLKVTVDQKQGLYDFATKQYFLPCRFDRVEAIHKYRRNEYIIVCSDHKYGLYSVKKENLIIPAVYDEVILKGGYAQLKQGRSNKIYSLLKNDMVNIGTAYESFELLDDGYALMFTSSTSGVYDIFRSRWHFSFGSRTRRDFASGEFNDLGENLLFIPGFGVLDYLKCTWQIRADLRWANWASRSGDYVTITGGFEGESKVVFSMKRGRMLMNYNRTYQMWPLSDSQYLQDEYLVFHSYGCHAGGTDDGENGEYQSPEWLPWNDVEGGAGLYIVDKDSWLFVNESGLDYFGFGLLYVADKGVYDLVLQGWALDTDKQLDYFKEAGNLYIEEKNAEGQKLQSYWFDTEARALVPVSETFTIYDYEALKQVNGVETYSPKSDDAKWKLFDSQDNTYISCGCDRISLMHKE